MAQARWPAPDSDAPCSLAGRASSDCARRRASSRGRERSSPGTLRRTTWSASPRRSRSRSWSSPTRRGCGTTVRRRKRRSPPSCARPSLLRSVHPDPAMRDAGERCEQEAEALATALALDPEVYGPLSRIDASGEDETTRWYLFRVLRDFRRAGVDKDEPTRARVRALNEELVRIGQEFQRNIRDDVRSIQVGPDGLEGLPPDYVRAHASGTITTDSPDYIPFMMYSRSSSAREQLWKVYRQRAHPRNLEVLDRMLARRHEMARLLRYESWAAYVTEDKMIG